ncbi:MAG: tetratricopeptide repeat protein [Candidatus Marinimicrobia bacterium]|nr:tetratricopeptide repeat protein [Candidatus Neomarinimicrobiota bacterium]
MAKPYTLVSLILYLFLALMANINAQNSKNYDRELRRLNAKIDRVRVLVDSLEFNDRLLLPELMAAFRQAVSSKSQQDSITVVIMKRINTLNNKIAILENQAKFMDSTALEIYNKLVMIENKIVTLTNSYNEMSKMKSGKSINVEPQFNAAKYKKHYMKSLGHFQNQEYDSAIKGFSELVTSDATNGLADNCQYWLAEGYYSKKDFKRAIGEFTKVFNYAGTDKDDDAQLKLGLAYQSMGSIEKAKEEFQRLIDYFPGSEYYPKAKDSLRKLSLD